VKKFILCTLVVAQTSAISLTFAEEESESDVLSLDAEGNIDLGGLLKVDKDGNVDIGAGDTSIEVDDGNVELSTSDTKIDVNGGDVDISAGGANISVDNGNVDLQGGGANISVDSSDSTINSKTDQQIFRDNSEAVKNRTTITDGVFFDSKGKAIKLDSGEFSRLEFADIEIPSQNFQGADFSWSTITNVSFSGSNLSGTDFSRTTLQDVDFSGANLTGVDLSWAKFENVTFSEATIIGSNLERTRLTEVNFSNAVVKGSCFENNKFVNVKMVNVDLTDSVFEDYDFSNVDFSNTDKGVAIWDADECAAIADYAQGATIAKAKVQSKAAELADRPDLIQASSIVKKLSEGVGTKIDLTVNFQTDSDQLFGNAHAQVAEIAKALKSNTLKDAQVIIEGHTDSEGTEDYNIDLSYRRASTVQGVLVKDYDVGIEFLSIKGFGENKPVANNDTVTGRSLNRRVTLVRQ